MGTFQELFLIVLSLFASLKLMSGFIHETFLVYKLETFKNYKKAKHITLCDIWLIDENYFQKMFSPSPPEKTHSPFKKSKIASPPPFWPTLHIFQLPLPPTCRMGGRTPWNSFSFTCGIVFNYRSRYDILSEEYIFTLWSFGGMYVLPSPVFFKGKFLQWESGKSWVVGIWQGVILTIWIFLKARNNIL